MREYSRCATHAAQLILQEILAMRPRAVIIDSIQTVYLDGVTGSAGSVSQVSVRRVRRLLAMRPAAM